MHAQVLVSTATLAWGVNLPAHTVIIKGTQVRPLSFALTAFALTDLVTFIYLYLFIYLQPLLLA